jgi:hypothetical protein
MLLEQLIKTLDYFSLLGCLRPVVAFITLGGITKSSGKYLG